MDLSPFIFVALAVAWAAYLVPTALKHHDDVVRSRSVDRFSHTLRVLARREPVNRRDARLVVTPGRPASAPVVTAKGGSAAVEPAARTENRPVAPTAAPTKVQRGLRREAARKAARRRRNVLAAILFANVVVLAVAASGVIGWAYAAVPGGLLVAWLVACRLMVTQERAAWTPSARMPIEVDGEESEVAVPEDGLPTDAPADLPADLEVVRNEQGLDEVAASADTSTIAAVATPASMDPTLWDPVPVTLPTYVTKPAATRRTVRTIDLDDTGVWTSGRTDADSRIVRDAEQAEQAAKADQAARKRAGDEHRAVGS